MRRILVMLSAVAALLSWSGAAVAHETVRLTVHGDGRGSVSVDVVWADGHPVAEPIAATMTAVGAGTRVGPVALSRLPGRPTVVYSGTLPAGDWQVTVDTALPGVGHCEAVVPVGQGRPSSTTCGPSAAPSTAAPAAAPRTESEPGWRWLWIAAAALVAALGGAIYLRRRRRSP